MKCKNLNKKRYFYIEFLFISVCMYMIVVDFNLKKKKRQILLHFVTAEYYLMNDI